MRAIASGDQAAFSKLYDILAVATYSICRHHLPVADDANLAMKAMWLYVWKHAHELSRGARTPRQAIMAVAESHAQPSAGSVA